jgi:hypothetical protein
LNFVHLDRFDAMVDVDVPVTEYLHPKIGEVELEKLPTPNAEAAAHPVWRWRAKRPLSAGVTLLTTPHA